jgi:hypothetical protein
MWRSHVLQVEEEVDISAKISRREAAKADKMVAALSHAQLASVDDDEKATHGVEKNDGWAAPLVTSQTLTSTRELLTVLVVTSPVKSNPSTAMMEKLFGYFALVPELQHCERKVAFAFVVSPLAQTMAFITHPMPADRLRIPISLRWQTCPRCCRCTNSAISLFPKPTVGASFV